MILKTEQEKNLYREAGHRLALILEKVVAGVTPGVTEKELDALARTEIVAGGDLPAFLNYRPAGAQTPYPATLCVSVNDRVVHGIPRDTSFQEGDIVSLDIGLVHKGAIVDMALTVPVLKTDAYAEKLLRVTREALSSGIRAACAGRHTGDIGNAIESKAVENGFSVVRELGGHGIGKKKLHEPPFIPNFGKKGEGTELVPGMLIAIEPIVNEGSREVVPLPDGYTLKTKDGKRSAHFEHTILITDGEAEIITKV